jgi:hypothetical protein
MKHVIRRGLTDIIVDEAARMADLAGSVRQGRVPGPAKSV